MLLFPRAKNSSTEIRVLRSIYASQLYLTRQRARLRYVYESFRENQNRSIRQRYYDESRMRYLHDMGSERYKRHIRQHCTV